MTIGERIKEARKNAGLTQKALGEKCHMPDSQIRQYELGMVKPKIEQVQRIATALGCDITDFLSISDVTPELKKQCDPVFENTYLQQYLECLGYTVLREESIRTVKKGYIDFELTDKEKNMLQKYGYVRRQAFPYFIYKDNNYYRMSEKQFNDMENEIVSSIEFQLWKYRVDFKKGKDNSPE